MEKKADGHYCHFYRTTKNVYIKLFFPTLVNISLEHNCKYSSVQQQKKTGSVFNAYSLPFWWTRTRKKTSPSIENIPQKRGNETNGCGGKTNEKKNYWILSEMSSLLIHTYYTVSWHIVCRAHYIMYIPIFILTFASIPICYCCCYCQCCWYCAVTCVCLGSFQTESIAQQMEHYTNSSIKHCCITTHTLTVFCWWIKEKKSSNTSKKCVW